MLYLQYRVLSQYTHGSLLSAASSAVVVDGQVINDERLPAAARLLVMRSACGSATFVLDFCKAGLEWPVDAREPPLNLVLAGIAARISDIVYPFSPGSA